MHMHGHIFISVIVNVKIKQIAIVRLYLVGYHGLPLLPLLEPLLILMVIFAVGIELGWDTIVTLHLVDHAILALNFLEHVLFPGLVKN